MNNEYYVTVADIDECDQPNNCAQLCNNTEGSYECYCKIGFKIDPNDSAKCIGTLIV